MKKNKLICLFKNMRKHTSLFSSLNLNHSSFHNILIFHFIRQFYPLSCKFVLKRVGVKVFFILSYNKFKKCILTAAQGKKGKNYCYSYLIDIRFISRKYKIIKGHQLSVFLT